MDYRKFNPIDDKMFRKMAEEREFCEEIIRVILGDPNLVVIDHHPQEVITNLKGRSVQLDAVCRLSDGKILNVEVQKYTNEDHQRRVRYYGSVLTANRTPAGTPLKDVVNVCIIYIARFDIFGAGCSMYHVDRRVRETGEIVYNGMEEIYVNAEARDGTDVSELMEVFTEGYVYSEKFPVTSELKRLYREGDEKMIRTLSDELREEGFKKVHEEGFRVGQEKGLAEGREEGREEGRAKGREEGLAEGRAEGIAEGKLEAIREIAQKLNLSEEDLQRMLQV